jgi:hypothetical protein
MREPIAQDEKTLMHVRGMGCQPLNGEPRSTVTREKGVDFAFFFPLAFYGLHFRTEVL